MSCTNRAPPVSNATTTSRHRSPSTSSAYLVLAGLCQHSSVDSVCGKCSARSHDGNNTHWEHPRTRVPTFTRDHFPLGRGGGLEIRHRLRWHFELEECPPRLQWTPLSLTMISNRSAPSRKQGRSTVAPLRRGVPPLIAQQLSLHHNTDVRSVMNCTCGTGGLEHFLQTMVEPNLRLLPKYRSALR